KTAPGRPADVELFTANALWTQTGTPILPEFQRLIEVSYRAGLYPVDFQAGPDQARRTINDWVAEQTRQKIRDLLQPSRLDVRTMLVLTNAIYFKALWARPFPKEQTAPADFLVTGQKRTRVELMNLTDRFPYLDGGLFHALELPYKGNELAMLILLP